MKTYNLIDTHCHLDSPNFGMPDDYLFEWAHFGITHFFLPSIGKTNWQKCLTLAAKYKQIYAGLGIHPWFSHEHQNEDIQTLRTLLEKEKPTFIGEIGLDYEAETDHEWMETLFLSQINMAKELNLPVSLHVRKAHQQVIKILKNKKFSCGGVIHAFSGSEAEAKQYIDMGFYLGLGPAVLKKNSKLLKSIPNLPLTSLVIETDSPDMAPSPRALLEILPVLCELTKENEETLKDHFYKNTLKAFRLTEL